MQSWVFAKRYHEDQEPEDVHDTLLVTADSFLDSQMDCWIKATKRLKTILLGDFVIEFVD
jgi:hypothetical protein